MLNFAIKAKISVMNFNKEPVNLYDNAFNKTQPRHAPKFKLWRSVGIMLTYKCPAACACCYVFSAPEINCPATEMSVEMAIDCWRATRQLCGDEGLVHITGGEPFLRFEILKETLKIAQEERLGGLEKVETNAAWCVNDDITQKRLSELAEYGLTKLQISTDCYHQQYVPSECVQRGIRIATEILGEDKVQVRWRDFAADPIHTEAMTDKDRNEVFTEALKKIPERMVGRAAEDLSHLVEQKPIEKLKSSGCRKSHMAAKGVHIDGAGNVFSSTCIGIITGKISHNYSLKDLWLDYNFTNHPIWSILTESGPYGLAQHATGFGFSPRETYCGKCHLCYDVRKYLFEKGIYPDHLGPEICYGKSV